jgi:hypothetical protein
VNPLFIIGFPRSGTTLLRNLLVSRLQILVPPESSFMTFLRPKYGDWTANDSRSPRLSEFLADLIRSKKFSNWMLDQDFLRMRVWCSKPGDYASLITTIYWAWCASTGVHSLTWGDKNNVHGLHLPDIFHDFPSAKVAWISREPLEIWQSYGRLASLNGEAMGGELAPRIPSNAQGFVKDWLFFQKQVAQAVEGRRDSTLSFQYSTLLENPNQVLKRIAQLLEIEARSDPLSDVNAIYGEEMKYPWKEKAGMELDSRHRIGPVNGANLRDDREIRKQIESDRQDYRFVQEVQKMLEMGEA